MIEQYNTNTLNKALSLLNDGHVIGMPTESVYGLAADATNDIAVARIYQAKGRPSFNPLIIHVDSIEMARHWGVFTPLAEKLANVFWGAEPRSLTLVMKRNNEALSHLVTAGLDTVAIRMPLHPVAIELITVFGNPLAAPSANRSNHISPTSAEAVEGDLGDRIQLIIDGGLCTVGLESTILDVSGDDPVLLRPGGTTVEMLENILQRPVLHYKEDNQRIDKKKNQTQSHTQENEHNQSYKAPGMTKRHYAPSIPLRLNIDNPFPGEAYLAFGKTCVAQTNVLNLSEAGDLTEAAANLFRMMRQLDNPTHQGIAVAPIPSTGIGLAINDRLKRASYVEK
ncbi:MAG: L-threonylcarbamoyladenylate synthase [Pseudomonadota bacterium]